MTTNGRHIIKPSSCNSHTIFHQCFTRAHISSLSILISYELSYDSQTLKYRFAVISSHVHLSSSGCYQSNSNGISNSDIPSLPLDSSSVDETISDNLEIRDLDWNPVGLVIRIPSGEGQCVGTNGIGSGNGHVNGNGNANGSVQARSMLVVVKLVYWKKRTR